MLKEFLQLIFLTKFAMGSFILCYLFNYLLQNSVLKQLDVYYAVFRSFYEMKTITIAINYYHSEYHKLWIFILESIFVPTSVQNVLIPFSNLINPTNKNKSATVIDDYIKIPKLSVGCIGLQIINKRGLKKIILCI